MSNWARLLVEWSSSKSVFEDKGGRREGKGKASGKRDSRLMRVAESFVSADFCSTSVDCCGGVTGAEDDRMDLAAAKHRGGHLEDTSDCCLLPRRMEAPLPRTRQGRRAQMYRRGYSSRGRGW